MPDYTRVENDTGRPLADTLQTDGSADDLTGATVVFTLWNASTDTVKIDENEANVSFTNDGSDGQVEYDFQSGDLDTTGLFYFEWEVTYSDGTIITYRKENGDPKTLTVKSEGS